LLSPFCQAAQLKRQILLAQHHSNSGTNISSHSSHSAGSEGEGTGSDPVQGEEEEGDPYSTM
jgi:hypothetical protein